MDKITSLLDRLKRVKLAQDMEPAPDGLSLSLWAMGAELAALDEAGLAAEAEALGISPDNVRQMALDFSRTS